VWGPLKCGGPCSAEHVRTLVNPALRRYVVVVVVDTPNNGGIFVANAHAQMHLTHYTTSLTHIGGVGIDKIRVQHFCLHRTTTTAAAAAAATTTTTTTTTTTNTTTTTTITTTTNTTTTTTTITTTCYYFLLLLMRSMCNIFAFTKRKHSKDAVVKTAGLITWT